MRAGTSTLRGGRCAARREQAVGPASLMVAPVPAGCLLVDCYDIGRLRATRRQDAAPEAATTLTGRTSSGGSTSGPRSICELREFPKISASLRRRHGRGRFASAHGPAWSGRSGRAHPWWGAAPPTIRRAALPTREGVRLVSPTDEPPGPLGAVDSDRATCRPALAKEGEARTREGSACGGEVYTGGRGLIGLVEDEVGCQGGRDRIAVSDEATLFTAVDPLDERLLDGAATEAMLGEWSCAWKHA